MKGKVAWNRGLVMPQIQGEKSGAWKGSKVGYWGLHKWVEQKLGKPKECERCGTKNAKRYEWSNKSREYLRDLIDWERLCVSCHRKEGYLRGEYTTWNKDTKGLMPIPWNKGLKLKV